MFHAESAGANCKTIYISDLNFNVNLADGYKTGKADELEEDLVAAQKLFQWANHVVMVIGAIIVKYKSGRSGRKNEKDLNL